MVQVGYHQRFLKVSLQIYQSAASPELAADLAVIQLTKMTDSHPPSNHGLLTAEVGALGTDPEALDRIFSVAYEELRRLASSVKRNDPAATLSPTTLVNEAWLKLANSAKIEAASYLHFKRIAARAMRQVLVEASRRRNAVKRGGGVSPITLDNDLDATQQSAEELLALDEALDELARIAPRQATMIESRFFGGLDVSETAQLLDISEATVLRDWRAARAWLADRLRPQD